MKLRRKEDGPMVNMTNAMRAVESAAAAVQRAANPPVTAHRVHPAFSQQPRDFCALWIAVMLAAFFCGAYVVGSYQISQAERSKPRLDADPVCVVADGRSCKEVDK